MRWLRSLHCPGRTKGWLTAACLHVAVKVRPGAMAIPDTALNGEDQGRLGVLKGWSGGQALLRGI